jgi:hypothetical protein
MTGFHKIGIPNEPCKETYKHNKITQLKIQKELKMIRKTYSNAYNTYIAGIACHMLLRLYLFCLPCIRQDTR